ncbi:GPW/gp25 family protein [Kordia algicida OT-1]|uniref:Tail lysozyme, putative n=1 Tax=Kordia algicida OT-1 TaxID=391587 RepID=A9DX78_9FLAO|nr:GPW/gp25 family protein [Kordia algicida]EDP95970.1 tail lysozyme, putative [Kordia algicida OT-1]
MDYKSATYLGKGWDFPPTFLEKRGEVKLISDIEDIEKSLQTIVTTRQGERLMRPKFGCDLTDQIFENLSATQTTIMKNRIKEAIVFYEPRIDVIRIALDTQNFLEGKFLIKVEYLIRATNTRRNIVFPYYITEATDI